MDSNPSQMGNSDDIPVDKRLKRVHSSNVRVEYPVCSEMSAEGTSDTSLSDNIAGYCFVCISTV